MKLIALVMLLILSAFFSASETALMSLNKIRIRNINLLYSITIITLRQYILTKCNRINFRLHRICTGCLIIGTTAPVTTPPALSCDILVIY